LRGSEKAHSTSQRSVDSAIAEERRAQVKEYTTLLQSLIRVSQKGTFFFFINVHFFLFVQKETNQRKRAPEMITSAFFGKMPLASRSQKRLKFTPFPVCHRALSTEDYL